MLIKLDQVHKSYGSYQVLKDVSFQINPGEHVGLVGRNGAGKTTIFRMIARQEEPDGGTISFARNLGVQMLAQQPRFEQERSLREEALSVFESMREMEAEMSRLEHLMSDAGTSVVDAELEAVMHQYSDLRHGYELAGGFSYAARSESVLFGLGFTQPDLDRPAGHLSGGQKGRLALAKLLLAEPDLLLLDEPTNHLDVDAVEWLEDFLTDYKGAFIIISHDRFLLDKVATKIVDVDRGSASSYPGNYTAFVRQREARRLAMSRQYEQQQEMIARTEEFIRRNIAGQKTKQAKSRRNMLERLDRLDAVEGDRTTDFKAAADAAKTARGGRSVLAATDLGVGYGSSALVRGITLMLQYGERLAIVGPNGSGKTTLVKTLTGTMPPVVGEFHWGANAKIGFYDQELKSLDPKSTVLAQLQEAAPKVPGGTSDGVLRSFLARFLFTDEAVFKEVSVLSGGEMSRLALARLVYSRPDVLILDEPTNHLDIPSREALEAALAEYSGTIIVVSHDRYFLGKLASQVLYLHQGVATHAYGGYREFYDAHRQRLQLTKESKKAIANEPAGSSNKPAARQKKRTRGGRSQTDIETEISLLESQLADLSDKLANPSDGADFQRMGELGTRHNSLASKLEALYQEWEAAALKAED
jgi:ATP-binding cassette subfamily F protein 3